MINSKNYLRQVGVSEVQFTLLLRQLEQEREKDSQNNKMKNFDYPSSLEKVLLAASHGRGYTQGINFIAALVHEIITDSMVVLAYT